MSQSSDDKTTGPTATGHLTDDDYYRLLSAERRRAVFEALADSTAPVELADLAAAVAAREGDADPDDETVRSVSVSLHHVHLPMMAALDVVDYDPAATRVASWSGRFDV